MSADPLKMLPKFSEYVEIRVNEIKVKNAPATGETVTVAGLDELIKDSLELKAIAEALGDIATIANKARAKLESKAGNFLRVLDRKDYKSPAGSVEMKSEYHVNMPETEQDKIDLFRWLMQRKIFMRYASVNSTSLNSLFMNEWEAAIKKDPEQKVLFSVPGVPVPIINEYTKIKAPRGQRSKSKKENEDE